MATIQRPLKEGSVRTYQEKVALNFKDILASEADADHDTMYAAWNGGVDTVNIKDGAVTFAKLATDAKPWTISGATLTPTDTTKTVTVGTLANAGTIFLAPRGLIQSWVSGSISNTDLGCNANSTVPNYDQSQPGWVWRLGIGAGNDWCNLYRRPAGTTNLSQQLLTIDPTGNLSAGTTAAGAAPRINLGNRMALESWDSGLCSWLINDSTTVGYNSASAGWKMALDYRAGGNFNLYYRVAGGVYGPQLTFDTGGSLTITGNFGVKATGTTWTNPSDRRLKDEIEDYPTGLDAILQLQPRTFVFNGKGGSQAGMRGYGFVADEIAPAMPETVGVRAGKLDPDDEDETDIQTLDQSNLILALVNATKELAARVAALEAR